MIKFLALALMAAPLAACALASVADSPAPQLFTLTAVAPATTQQLAHTNTQILVDEFRAPAAIDTTRIVYQLDANEMKYYAEGRWSDRVPQMIQSLLVETLENTGTFGAVAARESGLRADYFLVGDVRQFAAESVNGGTEAHVMLFARLVSARDGEILASRSFDSRVPVAGSGINAVVAAYDGALKTVLSDITGWSAQAIAEAPKPARTSKR